MISSIGASATSKNFYLNTKGRMEREMMEFSFDNLKILRPSLLVGPRNEQRFGEEFAKVAMSIFNPLFIGRLRKYRSIHAQTVAKAMINLLINHNKKVIFESDDLQEIAI
ncbi:MAG: hypothetical protein HC906_13010 [Bacteroidales bacterium]|nr:hypothetical protein [Bacteroidales bacterium]